MIGPSTDYVQVNLLSTSVFLIAKCALKYSSFKSDIIRCSWVWMVIKYTGFMQSNSASTYGVRIFLNIIWSLLMYLSAMIDIQYKMIILFVLKVYYLCYSYNVKLSNAGLPDTVYIMLNEFKISIFIINKTIQ